VGVSVGLAKQMHNLMPLFLSSSILLTALLSNRVSTWPALALLAAGSEVAAKSLYGDIMSLALLQSGINAVGPVLIASGLRKFTDDRILWYSSGRWFGWFIVLAISVPALASAGGAAFYAARGWPFLATWREWMVSDALGFLIATPFLLSWTEPALRREFSLRRLVEAAVLAVVTGGLCYFAFTTELPLLFVVFPCLALITLRAGLPGATIGALVFASVTLWFQVRGQGPIATLQGLDQFEMALILQAYFLTAGLATIPVAVILTLRKTMTDAIKQQGAITSAALNNMIQGICMFDKRDRLIICNRRYADLYNLPESLTAPGTPLIDMVAHLNSSNAEADLPEQHLRNLVAVADSKRSHSEVELADGKIIDVQCRTLDDSSWIATHEDVTEKRRASHRITYLASHDPLTDLPNRTFFREQLQRSLAFADRGHGFALHSLDLDRFKDVNDTLGHGIGDELLKQVAARLRGLVRDGDFVTRLGGDEFAILQFPLNKPEDASALAQRVVATLSEPYQIHGHDVMIGVTVGIALAPGDTSDAEDLLQKSDLALYRAKGDGRGTYRFFEQGMDEAQRARHAIENELRCAIRKGEFELHYQPILDLKSGAISSFEALVRWHHPTRGLIEPAQFIPVAEDTGLILPIGEWVLREACREAAGWGSSIKVAVNLSPVQFKSRNLLGMIKSALSAAGLAPEMLELEITESVLLNDTDSVLGILHQIRDMGVGVAMDDFGTGYSSLSYLRSFPFSRIKIDRCFISDLATHEESRAIIHATVELSGKLGMTSTAEGVETAEQLAILQAEGCTHIQGYYISRPIPANSISEMVRLYGGKENPSAWRKAS
jgi:diguanylate cyclase (GGDEF)-like protein